MHIGSFDPTGRSFVCMLMVILVPVSLFAQDQAGAMLHSSGAGVQVNDSPAPWTIAVFPNDLIQTPNHATARLNWIGSTANIDRDSLVQFGADELVLDHGRLSVSTWRGLRVRVGCVTITPLNDAIITQYDVIDVDGKVTVSAETSDVYLDARSSNFQPAREPKHSNREIVREREQKSRSEKCGGGDIRPGAPATPGALLNSPWAIGAGAVPIIVLGVWVLHFGDDPVSPSTP